MKILYTCGEIVYAVVWWIVIFFFCFMDISIFWYEEGKFIYYYNMEYGRINFTYDLFITKNNKSISSCVVWCCLAVQGSFLIGTVFLIVLFVDIANSSTFRCLSIYRPCMKLPYVLILIFFSFFLNTKSQPLSISIYLYKTKNAK